MFFADKLELGKPRRTKEGYMAVRAKAARAGVYDYLGREVDPEGKHFAADQVVKVHRPESEVFAKSSVHSFLLKPITDDHPHEAVTADNWKQHAKGVNAGAMRDGEHLAFDLVIMDASAIQAVDDGKKELSNGYACELTIGDGVTADGTAFQATQHDIVGNHIALVAKGRAGPECRIGDAASCEAMPQDSFGELMWKMLRDFLADERTYSGSPDGNTNEPARRETSNSGGSHVATKTITFDGLPLEVTDAAEAAITKLQNQLKDEKARAEKAEGQVATLTTDKGKLEGEKVGLEKQLKDATDPATLQAAATARATLINKAMAVSPNLVTDGKSDADIRKEVVNAKLGDDAKDFDDAKFEGAFLSLTRDAPTADPVRAALSTGVRSLVNDNGASVRDLARAAQF